uniref:Gag-asp_proteas domain-containing protein n=1 Tax=Lactuca sativa TaxID=4236 RepID=A0A9R1VZ37_LACSA|nr:hypothetical protein LSAT_V11C400166470 [Lactuca sativa]
MGGGDRPLIEAQLNEKRACGLSYRCDEKWNKNHRCKSQVNVILVEEGEEEQEEEVETEVIDPPAALDSTDGRTHRGVPQFSSGSDLTKIMKMPGKIFDLAVVTFIDPGATHNFISSQIVKELALPITDTEPYGVRMGTGDNEEGRGICRGVMLQLQELDIVEEFLPLRLRSSNVILGIKWLETLGTTQTN